MAVIQDLVLTFCPTMHSFQQKKLKLLMPVLGSIWPHLTEWTHEGPNQLQGALWG